MAPALHLSNDIWHEDGDVVIVCERTAFRVHLDVLASHSAVFRDMAALPQPAGEQCERYDGCPVIRLQDAVADMRHFLKAIYNLQ